MFWAKASSKDHIKALIHEAEALRAAARNAETAAKLGEALTLLDDLDRSDLELTAKVLIDLVETANAMGRLDDARCHVEDARRRGVPEDCLPFVPSVGYCLCREPPIIPASRADQ